MSAQTKKSIILTAYPLSAPFEHAVRNVIGQGAQTVTVAQLRSQGLTGLLRQLLSMRGDPIVLPIEEVNSSALLPVLKLLAGCTRSRSIHQLHEDHFWPPFLGRFLRNRLKQLEPRMGWYVTYKGCKPKGSS